MSGYESDTCGRSYTIRIRYVWTQIFLYPHKKICGYKNLRIRVDGALINDLSFDCRVLVMVAFRFRFENQSSLAASFLVRESIITRGGLTIILLTAIQSQWILPNTVASLVEKTAVTGEKTFRTKVQFFAPHILILEQNCSAKINRYQSPFPLEQQYFKRWSRRWPVHSIFKAKVSHHWSVNVHLRDWKWKETVSILAMMSKEEQRAMKTWDRATEEDNICHVLLMWILYKCGNAMVNQFQLSSTKVFGNSSTQKCSSPHLLTVGYF